MINKNKIDKSGKCLFRRATLDDLSDMMRINDQFEHRWTLEKFHEVFEHDIAIDVAFNEDNILVGYIIYFYVLDEGRIINLAVDKLFQNKSVGRQLMFHALEEMYNSNMHYALLDVKTDNLSAIHLYTKMGFQILCRRDSYYTGEVVGDSYFMQIRL